MNTFTPPCAVNQNTAAALTGRSVRTWQRRIEQGLVPRLGDGKTLVPFNALVPELVVAIAQPDLPLLARADEGEAGAQAELGALLALGVLTRDALARGVRAEADRGCKAGAAAQYFLLAAAEQGQADAMHWLALLHAAGLARDGNRHESDDGKALALMWLARAAAHGHAIARGQLAGLVPGGGDIEGVISPAR